ncbi:hypothetical protein B0H67DRAFT_137215 [Lasiosphaeris hirsuta]|uniref:Uncharacterized protein n=1 Tax=Lasiosphaeris hirsuta TaxID=260670 RepID=A0AA40B112_9PEZI|nr:hypothetical protein B0H67DRAFT_137215 [Lasiosphaeris hirsuta]
MCGLGNAGWMLNFLVPSLVFTPRSGRICVFLIMSTAGDPQIFAASQQVCLIVAIFLSRSVASWRQRAKTQLPPFLPMLHRRKAK